MESAEVAVVAELPFIETPRLNIILLFYLKSIHQSMPSLEYPYLSRVD